VSEFIETNPNANKEMKNPFISTLHNLQQGASEAMHIWNETEDLR